MSLKGNEAKRTGLVFDKRMVEHHCLFDSEYPECPARFSHSLERCETYGLVKRCQLLASRPATKDELLLQHDLEYIEFVEKTKDNSDKEYLSNLSAKFDAVYFHPTTYDLSLLSAGCVIDLATEIAAGKLRNGMAIVRPPGHHALKDKACGYCYFNNVAIAAKHVLDDLEMRRILIVDWDVHHGQATQYAFYDDPRVLYFSIHRYENGTMWPNLRESNYDYVGIGSGKGFNVNVPLNKVGLGNNEYLAIFHQLLMPIAYEFSPELVIVSAGYDAAIGCQEFSPELVFVSAGFDSAIGDEKGEMEVTPACYAHLTSMLMSLANGKICTVLEGGYCLRSLSEGVALTLRTLLGDPCPSIGPTAEPDPSAIETILNVIHVQRPFWKCLQFQGSRSETNVNSDSISKKVDILEDNDWPDHRPSIEYHGVPPEEPFPLSGFYPVQTKEVKEEFAKRIDELIEKTDLTYPTQRTCIAYDKQMALHRNLQELHPEKPERLIAIVTRLEDAGLLERCKLLESRIATQEEVELIHCKEHVQEMKDTEMMKPRDLLKVAEKFRSIFLCHDSFSSALLAVGCVLQVVDEVLSGRSRNGAAAVRPPGHHAENDEACGFCIFNNVAIAAKYALDKRGLQRILILDWDVHHGNGIQNAFYDDPRVLYISIHRYNNGGFFPSWKDANYNYVGRGKGEGFNVNIPWNTVGLGDADYLAAFTNIVLPIAYQFDPQLVLISAGFDAARGDFLGNCKVSPEGYATMTQLLCGVANGKVILTLEGGYNLRALSTSFAMCVKVLLGDSFVGPSPGLSPCPSAVQSINSVISAHKKFWSCLKYQVNLPALRVELEEEPDNNVAKVEGAEGGADDTLSLADDLKQLKITMSTEDDYEGFQAYAVIPKTDCPHLRSVRRLPDVFSLDVAASKCARCGDMQENWICLLCHEVFCGRYINGHMLDHYDGSDLVHCLAISMCDLSSWCYVCDSYIHDEDIITPIKEVLHERKFGIPPPKPSKFS